MIPHQKDKRAQPPLSSRLQRNGDAKDRPPLHHSVLQLYLALGITLSYG